MSFHKLLSSLERYIIQWIRNSLVPTY